VLQYNLVAFHNRVLTRINKRIYHNKVIKILFWLMLLAYPPVSTTTLRVYSCTAFGSKKYLSSDFSLECYDAKWQKYAGLASIGVITYIIGIPLTFFLVIRHYKNAGVDRQLRRVFRKGNEHLVDHYLDNVKHEREEKQKSFVKPGNRKAQEIILRHYFCMENLRNHWNRARVGFIYFSYEEHVWWYEIFELFRKLFLNGIVVFVGRGSLAQIILSCFMCLGALYVALNIKPYQDDSDDLLANICLGQLFLSLFLGLFVRLHTETNQAPPEWVSILIIVSNVVVLLVGLSLVFNEKMASNAGLNMAYKRRAKQLQRKKSAKKLWTKLGGNPMKKIRREETLIELQRLGLSQKGSSVAKKVKDGDDYSWPDSDLSDCTPTALNVEMSSNGGDKEMEANRFASWGSAGGKSPTTQPLSESSKHEW
jgi:hypothetical protein